MKKQFENQIIEPIDQIADGITKTLEDDLKIPIFMISHLHVEDFQFSSPYCLYVIGNECHRSFDYKFLDHNCKAIVKPYPFMNDYEPLSLSNYEIDDFGRYFISVEKEDERVLNLPLGSTKNFSNKNRKKTVKFGFWGQSSGIRSQIMSCFSEEALTKNIYSGFGITRNGEDYSEFISSCEISLCPMGHSPETYRLYESAAAGCALIGTPLPKTDYYLECPILTLPWQLFSSRNHDQISDILNFANENTTILQSHAKKWADKWTNVSFLSGVVKKHIEEYA